MTYGNPILALAERALREQLSAERLGQESERLARQGLPEQILDEGLDFLGTPTNPEPLVEILA
jgi:hypothetical protein